MGEWTVILGAFVRWLLKGCKTNLKDEIDGYYEPRWVGNYITGLITSVIIIMIALLFIKYIEPLLSR